MVRELTNEELERLLVGVDAAFRSGKSPIKTPLKEAAEAVKPLVEKYAKERDILFNEYVEVTDKMTPKVKEDVIKLQKPSHLLTYEDFDYKDEDKFYDLLEKLSNMKSSVEIPQVDKDRAVIITTPEGEEKVPMIDYLEMSTSVPPNLAIFINEYFIK